MPDPGEDPNVPAAGVASFDGQTWTTYTTADGLASNDGEIVVASDGTVWVVHGDAGLSRLDGDTWTDLAVLDVASSRRSGAVGGSDGTLWLGTDNGIVHFDGTDTTRYTVPGEMAPAAASSFSLEPTASAAGSVDAGSVRRDPLAEPTRRPSAATSATVSPRHTASWRAVSFA